MNAARAIQELHDRCAVYTAAPTAAKLLDMAGWTAASDLSQGRLLEPCVGEGAILTEAVDRLLQSFRTHDRVLALDSLADRIVSFEIHAETAKATRARIERALKSAGLTASDAKMLSTRWVRKADFLLAEVGQASHVVANPPYVRWSKLPKSLASAYRLALRETATRGDLAVAFIDRMLDWADGHGSVVALVSDRWMFAQYGAAFVEEIAGRGWALNVLEERPSAPFIRDVGAYSAIVGFWPMERRPSGGVARRDQRQIHAELVDRHGTIEGAGCVIRVGPALGCGRTYILDETASVGVEPELLRPYLARGDLAGPEPRSSGLMVACPYDARGKPIILEDWPGFARWAEQHRAALSSRSCVRPDGPWWRTIDAIGPQWAVSPKLIVPEVCQRPKAFLDATLSIPAHSLYVVWSCEWPTSILQRVLNAGLMRITAEACAPQLKHGYYRFYRRFLARTPLPRWSTLDPDQQRRLAATSDPVFAGCFEELFGFAPDSE